MSLTSDVLRDNALRATADGLELDLRLPWYRSLPVSCVERLEVIVAGRPVSGGKMRFAAGGPCRPLADLGRHPDDTWFVLDPATLLAPAPPGLRRGDKLPVSVRLDCRIPYILVGPDRALVQSVAVEKELLVN